MKRQRWGGTGGWTDRKVDPAMSWLTQFPYCSLNGLADVTNSGCDEPHDCYLSHSTTNSSTCICNFSLPLRTFFPHTQTNTNIHIHTHCHYHCGAVLRAAGQDVVVMRAPVNIEDRSGVADHQRVVLIHTACLQHTATVTHRSELGLCVYTMTYH